MTTFSIPAGTSLPPAFTARERAKVDAYFGHDRRTRHGEWFRLMLPLMAALSIVTVVVSVG